MSEAPSPKVQPIDAALIENLLQQAGERVRRRVNHNFHSSMQESCHRFLNVLAAGTYVTPHRHTAPPKSESFVVLRGSLLFCLFDDAGDLTEAHRLGPHTPTLGIDIAPGLWHSLVVDGDHAVVFEVKAGPYEPVSDKDFAPWAPRESEPGASAYLDSLLARARRACRE